VVFPRLELQLAAAQIELDVGKLHQEQFVLVARLQIRALIAVVQAPGLGAQPDGAVGQPPAVFAAWAFRVGQEPFQPLSELRQAETLLPGEAVEPDVGPDLLQVILQPGDRLQETGVAQLAIITQTAITLSHGLSPVKAFNCQISAVVIKGLLLFVGGAP